MIEEIITFIFLLIILSYYVLLFLPKKKIKIEKSFSSITIIIPAHNEEPHIKKCILSVKNASFKGKKEIIVVDDGSRDNTGKIAKSLDVKVLKTKHLGKSAAINKALEISNGEVIAIVDGDSYIEKESLVEITKELSKMNVGASTGVIKVENRRCFFGMWFHLEQIYNSLMREILSKINGNITTPGPLSAYRKDVLEKIGGFSTEGFSEDQDITIRIIREGYRVHFSRKSISSTTMPHKFKWVIRQRMRFARGIVNILKRHMKINSKIIDIYTLPLFLFGYIQAIIMGSITLFKVGSGYFGYFVSKGVFLNFEVLKFFFEWFSIIGFLKWSFSVFLGNSPLNFITVIGIASTFLSYPLFLFAILRYDKKIDFFHIIAFTFMAPFWLFIMVIYILGLPEIFRKKQYNRWIKNE